MQQQIINKALQLKPTRKLIYNIGSKRASNITKYVLPHLKSDSKIIDIGAGLCNVCEILTNEGHDVTPLDITDLSCVDNIQPTLYDGDKIPFDDNSFDTALILTVLHHTPYPEEIVKEAVRVAKRVIIIEDIYTSTLHKYLTFGMDSLLNFEFKGHPHTNKNDVGWRDCFNSLDLTILNTEYPKLMFPILKHILYVLEKK